MEKNFTHIHCHTDYSLLDGMGSPAEKAKRAKELNMKAIAITDHNNLGGTLAFQKACKAEGIKPLLGVESYWTWEKEIISLPLEDRYKLAEERAAEEGIILPKKITAKDKKEILREFLYDSKSYHIILIAKNQIGWNNLIKIQSIAAEKGLFNGRFHCDNELLKQYSEGIICTTACAGSITSKLLMEGRNEEAEKVILDWIDIFGKENLFLEIQPLDWDKQLTINLGLIDIAKKHDLKLIATNDSHYTRQEDIYYHDLLICLQYERLVTEEDRVKYKPEYWLRSYDEMIEAFKRNNISDEYMNIVVEALENTNLIADMVDENILIGSDKPLFTNVDIPKKETYESFLSKKCWRELYKYLKEHPTYDRHVYEDRLKWELFVINNKGYAPYMLTVDEYINWSNNNRVPTGPGRGSAAGSLVLFLLKITKIIDPIQNNLLFSRFLTMDRTALPDIDSDFCYYGRQKVIKHMEDLYGSECVAHIGTYTELGVKSGIKDVGKVLGMSFAERNRISKEIGEIFKDEVDLSFKYIDSLIADIDLDKVELLKDTDKEKYNNYCKYMKYKKIEDEYKDLFDAVRKLEGNKRNYGIHASGILVTPCPINDVFPVRFDKDTGARVTLYTGPEVEECNGVKYDFLGLKTVSVIDKALYTINKELTWDNLYNMVTFDDEQSFALIRNKNTDAIFQLESDMFKGLLSQIYVDNLDGVTLLTSIGRPGPLQAKMHEKYANRQKGIEPIVMPLPNVEDIVGDTLGTIVYQEQIMAISKKVSGFDDNQADSYLRKALAKKKRSMMDLCKRWFVYGKKNEKAPEGYIDTDNSTMYDEEGKYGVAIKGGINNGYKEEDLITFWNDIEGYASYLSNK